MKIRLFEDFGSVGNAPFKSISLYEWADDERAEILTEREFGIVSEIFKGWKLQIILNDDLNYLELPDTVNGECLYMLQKENKRAVVIITFWKDTDDYFYVCYAETTTKEFYADEGFNGFNYFELYKCDWFDGLQHCKKYMLS